MVSQLQISTYCSTVHTGDCTGIAQLARSCTKEMLSLWYEVNQWGGEVISMGQQTK